MKSSSNLPSDDVLGRPQDVLLRWTGRINRARFFGANFVVGLVFGVALAVIVGLAALLDISLDGRSFLIFSVFSSLAAQSSIVFQRAHDVGVSGSMLLVLQSAPLIYTLMREVPELGEYGFPPVTLSSDDPIAMLLALPFFVLAWWPGQKGENRYGPAPKPV